MSDNLSAGDPDWQWWQIAAVVVGGVATMAVVGYLASGGKSSQELRSEHHKRPPKGHVREIGDEHGPRHVPRAATKKEPSHLQLLLERGSKERETNPRRAIDTYVEALDLILKETKDPSHLFVGVVEQSLARCYISLEKYAVAKKKLLKSIRILQTNSVAPETIMEFRCQLALAHVFLREFAEAEEIVNAAVEMATDRAQPSQTLDAQAQDILGQLRRRQGRYREAEKAIRKAMKFWIDEFGLADATSIETRQRLIDILLLRGREDLGTKEAKAFLDDMRLSLTEMRPELQKQVLGTLLTNLGMQFFELGVTNQAESFFEEAKRMYPDNQRAQMICNWHLASIHAVRGEAERSQELIDSLLSTPLETIVVASLVSQYFSSRTETGFVPIVDQEDSTKKMLKFRVLLRALEHVYPLESFDVPLDTSDVEEEEEPQPRVSALDEIDDEDTTTTTAPASSSASSSSSSSPNTARLPVSFFLVASLNGPEDTLVPDVTLSVDSTSNFGELSLESELFEVVPPGVYSITVTAYTDESREHKITEHKQYFPWKLTEHSEEFEDLARLNQRRKEAEEDDLRVLNAE